MCMVETANETEINRKTCLIENLSRRANIRMDFNFLNIPRSKKPK